MLLLLFLVLGLEHADRAALGAVAPVLKRVFDITNAQIGQLAAAVSIAGALATVPVGILADRASRTRLLAMGVAAWSAAMALAGAAVSFAMLLGTRVLLGAVTATARPTTSSIVGDVYPAEERGRVLGVIESGMLLGTVAGFLIGGITATFFSWRLAFWVLGGAGIGLAVAFWRVGEPARTRMRRRPSAAVGHLGRIRMTPVGRSPPTRAWFSMVTRPTWGSGARFATSCLSARTSSSSWRRRSGTSSSSVSRSSPSCSP